MLFFYFLTSLGRSVFYISISISRVIHSVVLICDKIGWIGSQSLFPTLIICTIESCLFDYSVILLLIGRCNGLFCVWRESFYPMGTYQTRVNVVKENGLQNVPQEDSFRKTRSPKGSRRRNICEQCVSNRKVLHKLSLTFK